MRLTFAVAAAGLALAALPAARSSAQPPPAPTPIEVRVVVVTTWEERRAGKDAEGELSAWEDRWPLPVELPFPTGVHPLRYDPKDHVLGVVTGVATARAAASVMALGLDPRFDLSHAYWLVAGTAGVDPKVASAGSVAWSRWVVDGDLMQELDPRDAPADWPTGVVPYGRTRPYEAPPPPPQSPGANVAYRLDRGLVDWAYEKTREAALPDDALLQRLRAPYSGSGARPPFVLEGEGLMSARNWYADRLNDWAERWVDYWTRGQGVFAMSAEEDSGILQALTQLSGAGRVRLDRVLVLRAASDYTLEPPGMAPADFLAKETKEGFPGNAEALDDLYRVGAPVVRELAEHWPVTRETTPGA